MTRAAEPPALTPAQVAELKVMMTSAGYEAAVQEFGATTIAHFVWTRRCLLLAAADLLDGLPIKESGGTGVTEGPSLTAFKLDVLEFKFASTKAATVDYGAISRQLRDRAVTECVPKAVASNPEPEFQSWSLV